MKIYETENIINCRDLGGYEGALGTTLTGRAVRCGIPVAPSSSDIELLKNLGIKTVIDLRGSMEVIESPSVFYNRRDFDYHNISLLETNPAFAGSDIPMWEMYVYSLENNKRGYADAIRLFTRTKGPVMFHCFLGKDRTGLLAALLLSCAGVGRDDIVDDYSASYELIEPFVTREIELNTGLVWETDVSRLRSDPENMELLLDYIDEEYTCVKDYLLDTGLSEGEIEAAGRKLTEE